MALTSTFLRHWPSQFSRAENSPGVVPWEGKSETPNKSWDSPVSRRIPENQPIYLSPTELVVDWCRRPPAPTVHEPCCRNLFQENPRFWSRQHRKKHST